MRQLKIRSGNPITYSLDLFGDKWTLLILRDMIFSGKTTYKEFLSSEERIASSVLADRLYLLEDQGFILRHISPANRSSYIYSLTEKAIDLLPVIIELYLWGCKYKTPAPQDELLSLLIENKHKTVRQLSARLKKQLVHVKK